jgi:hypothetical protein
MQQALARYHGNAIWCIDHVTKENLICHSIIILIITIISGGVDNWLKRRSTGKRKHVIR